MLLGGLLGLEVTRDPAEAEDEDPVGDLEDVGEVVADHDHAEVALAQPPDQRPGPASVWARRARRSARRAARLSAHRAASGRPRPAGADRRRGFRPRCAGSGSSPPGSRAARPARCSIVVSSSWRGRPGRAPARSPPGRGRGSRPRRGCRRAPGPGRRWRSRVRSRPGADRSRPRSPSKRIAPESIAVDPGDRLDQRRLAGAVVADQADDLAGVDVEVDPVQSLDRAEALACTPSTSSRAPFEVIYVRLRLRDPQLLCRPRRMARCRVRPAVTNSSLITVSLDVVFGHRDRFEQDRRHFDFAVVDFFGDLLPAGGSSPSASATAISAAALRLAASIAL